MRSDIDKLTAKAEAKIEAWYVKQSKAPKTNKRLELRARLKEIAFYMGVYEYKKHDVELYCPYRGSGPSAMVFDYFMTNPEQKAADVIGLFSLPTQSIRAIQTRAKKFRELIDKGYYSTDGWKLTAKGKKALEQHRAFEKKRRQEANARRDDYRAAGAPKPVLFQFQEGDQQ